MLHVDITFANRLSPQLRNFKRKSDFLWNFSCPICGDSKTNKTKARGYIYKAKGMLFVKCHKCSYGSNLGNLIKRLDPTLYQEYVTENYKENGVPRSVHKDADIAVPAIFKAKPKLLIDDILSSIKPISALSAMHPARRYLVDRMIPESAFDKLYFAPRFKTYVNRVLPGKFTSVAADHPRLVIPYLNAHGKATMFQGRAFGQEQPKYYTIKLDEDEERIYGLASLDFARRIYVVEGPLDSLFIPNSIAVSGSSFGSPTIEALRTNATVVYDNEPRSPELCKLIGRTIKAGFDVCLWPESVEEKDINEMVLAGRTPKELLTIINDNTFSGIDAQLKFTQWKRC